MAEAKVRTPHRFNRHRLFSLSAARAKIHRQFTTADAREKLAHLCLSLSPGRKARDSKGESTATFGYCKPPQYATRYGSLEKIASAFTLPRGGHQ